MSYAGAEWDAEVCATTAWVVSHSYIKKARTRILTRLNVVHGVDTLPAETSDAGAVGLASLALVPAALAGLGDGTPLWHVKVALGLQIPPQRISASVQPQSPSGVGRV